MVSSSPPCNCNLKETHVLTGRNADKFFLLLLLVSFHFTCALTLSSSIIIAQHESFSDGQTFCKIDNVCRVGDGSLLLPSEMKEFSEHLRKCGLHRVSFVLGNDRGPSTFVSKADGTKSMVSLSYEYEDMDVVGSDPPRGKRELLAYDITPYIFMMSLFSRSESASNSRFQCFSSDPNSCRRYQEDRSENAFLNPLLLIDARISNSKEHHWPKSLLRLIKNSVMGNLKIVDMKDLYGWKVRTTASCFHSILSTIVGTGDMSTRAFDGSNRFFEVNGLSRNSAGRVQNSTMPCVCKVLILNRFGKRYIVGGDVLTQAVTSYGKKVASVDPSVRIEAEEVFFENSSFHEQVSIMQESSIVVASHGDTNSNFMFLKPGSYVFEIFPFGYKSDMFRNISVAYGVRYQSITSQGDLEVFQACIEHYNSNRGSSLAQYLMTWEHNAKRFLNETMQKKRNVGCDFEIPEEGHESFASLKNLKECASYQRLSVDIKDLARQVALAAGRQCGIGGKLTLLD